MKIYVHNFFNELLFLTLAHNSTNRVYNIDYDKQIGNIICDYKNHQFEFIFNPEINDNTDGVHLIDYFSIHLNHYRYKHFAEFKPVANDKTYEINIIKRITELLSDKKDWLFLYLRTEKILANSDVPYIEGTTEVDALLQKLNNHKIITDNVFLNDVIELRYPNFYHTFTNTIYNWNHLIGIRWYYEFKDLFKNLNKPYDIGFSMRRIKKNRKNILKLLKEQNNEKIFLSFTDYMIYDKDYFNESVDNLLKTGLLYNSKKGNNDFENIENISNLKPIGLDLFFRILPKSKMQILDESWANVSATFTHQYISEKTIGYILAGIPFISTNVYPLDILEKVLDIERHPFYLQTKECYSNHIKFSNFVKTFLEDFDKNYALCLEWSEIANKKMIDRILSKNDLLDLFISGFDKNHIVKKSLI